MANIFSDVGNILFESIKGVWDSMLVLIPGILAAIVIIFIGWVIGKILRRILIFILSRVGIDKWVKRHGLSPALWGKDFSSVTGNLVKWYIILIFSVQGVSLIESGFIHELMQSIKPFVHVFFIAGCVLIITSLFAENIKKMIEASDLMHRKTIGNAVKFLILYFVLLLVLQILGVQTGILGEVFKIAFMAFAITIAIIVGVGFGLNFSDDAKAIVDYVKKKKK